jgi:cystathionine beta-lyase/cystathionine gamma-synthase
MTEESKKLDITTQLVHAGRIQSADIEPVTTPIYPSVTFTFDSMKELDSVLAGEKSGFTYTRYGNPTIAALEEAVRVIEDGDFACAYATGMAALHAALFACELGPGSTVLASQDLYGATTNLLLNVFGSFGVKTVSADFNDLETLRERVTELNPRVLVAETISNPLLKVCDIEAIAEVAHAAGARLIVDNTFASPYLCQPLKLGADLVVHSATKYLGGHGDVMGGIVVARDSMDSLALVGVMKLVGGVLGVMEAHEIRRGLKTLALRIERQCENARVLAEHLQSDARVGRVYYPGFQLKDVANPAKRVLRQPYSGALVSIELSNNTREAAYRFMDALSLCIRSTSLGDVFSSVLHPVTSSHRDFAPARRKELGITDGLVRISVGIEDVNDLIADIQQALAQV